MIRSCVLGFLIPGIVLLGNSAGAQTLAAPHHQSKRSHSGSANPKITVNVYGHHNNIAMKGAVLTVAGRGPVDANTGDVSSSGALGIDTDRSSLESGSTSAKEPAQRGEAPVRVANAVMTGRARHVAKAGRAPSRTAERKPPALDHWFYPMFVSKHVKSTAISGYEDHSVHVIGEDQIAVYDDSNLFVNRNGRINGNTGDTDSSGLNAVNVSGSTVRSGDHIESDENDDESEDEKDEQEATPERPTGRPATSAGTRRVPSRQASSAVSDDDRSSAKGDSALTIGGDGYDNLGVDVRGKRNIAAYDDSNVVIGGTGGVNAQIGDSDTSGAVVMGIKHSKIRSGNST